MEAPVKNSNGWQTTPAGQHLQERLNDEHTLRSIDHLLARINTLEIAVEKLTTLLEQGPGMIAMAADMADETYRQAAANGVNIEQRLTTALQLAERLTEPKMMEGINKFIDTTEQAPGIAAMTMDMVDETYRQAAANGINIEQRLMAALQIAEKLTAPEVVEKVEGLMKIAGQLPGIVAMTMDMVDEELKQLNAGGFDAAVLMDLLEKAGQATAEAQQHPPVKVGGIFSLLRAMRDPDRQKAIGFWLNVTKYFGQKI